MNIKDESCCEKYQEYERYREIYAIGASYSVNCNNGKSFYDNHDDEKSYRGDQHNDNMDFKIHEDNEEDFYFTMSWIHANNAAHYCSVYGMWAGH